MYCDLVIEKVTIHSRVSRSVENLHIGHLLVTYSTIYRVQYAQCGVRDVLRFRLLPLYYACNVYSLLKVKWRDQGVLTLKTDHIMLSDVKNLLEVIGKQLHYSRQFWSPIRNRSDQLPPVYRARTYINDVYIWAQRQLRRIDQVLSDWGKLIHTEMAGMEPVPLPGWQPQRQYLQTSRKMC